MRQCYTEFMTKQEFKEALEARHLTISDHQLEQFETYLHLLQEWNEKMNLTAITAEEEVWEKHFLDSVLPFLDQPFETMADVGSGAGFPGIPVAILFPERKMTLIEPLTKRCKFLNEVKDKLHLDNVTILNRRAEEAVKEHREEYDLVSARAVARLSILLELVTPLLKTGGIFIALKGPAGHDELKAAAPALKTLAMQLEKEQTEEEGDSTRLNLYFKKMKSTPARYPRAYGQIKKKPMEESNV